MLNEVKSTAERMAGKTVVILLGTLLCSLLLLTAMSFLGYAIFLASLHWLPPGQSALLTGLIFLLMVALVAFSLRCALAPRGRRLKSGQRRQQDLPVSANAKKSVISADPAICLPLAVFAGYLYQSQPQLKAQVDKTLLDLARAYSVDSVDNTGRR